MKFGFSFVFLLLSLDIFAQDSTSKQANSVVDKSTDVLVGINWQGNGDEGKNLWRFYEIGLAKAHYINNELGTAGSAIYMSEEIYFGGDGNVYGTKIGVWPHQFLDVGLAAIYYTDFNKGNFKLRGEAGFGYARTRAVFGYNLPTFDNKAFRRLTKHDFQISIQTTFGLYKKSNHKWQ